MATRIKWDKYEVALLIDTFWHIENDSAHKREYIQKLSTDLRQKAMNTGFEIDDIFRNFNGISMQLAPIAHAFFPERPTLTTSALFEEMVSLYKNDRESFLSILDKAKSLVKGEASMNRNNKQAFLDWLAAKKYKKYAPNAIAGAMEDASEYCLNKRISKTIIWEIDNPNEFMFVANKLTSMKLFRILHKSTASVFNAIAPLYKDFLKERSVLKTSIANGNIEQQVEKSNNTDIQCLNVMSRSASQEQILNDFYTWMFNEQKLAKASCASYVSAIKTSDEFARAQLPLGHTLFTEDCVIVQNTIAQLFRNDELKQKNDDQHNRYFAALRKYLLFVETTYANFINQPKMNEEIKNDADPNVKKSLEIHFVYGINTSSPIEMLRFRNYYVADHGIECALSDECLMRKIKDIGTEFEGKYYLVHDETIEKIKDTIIEAENNSVLIIYYEDFYNENEDWLYKAHIMSAQMLKEVISRLFITYQIKSNYIILSNQKITELNALKHEIARVWGNSKLRSFAELHEKLPWVPLEKIKYGLSNGENYFWNSFETYANKNLFVISEAQLNEIKDFVSESCDQNGSVQFEKMPLCEVSAENYELSETALFDIIFSYLADDFSRNSKVITRKGKAVDVSTSIDQYCHGRETCKMAELEAVMKETAGEVRYPIIIEAANTAMVRVDYDNFVADSKVMFDIAAIDLVLDEIVFEDGIGLKEIATFNAFPYCGYTWNLFLLESYCRRFSKRYRYACITPNSRNAGVIISKDNELDYHTIMAKAVARATIDINEKDVFEFLIASGFMIRRQYANMGALLELATAFREGR